MTQAEARKGLLGRVLVADDDAAIRRLCVRVLGNEGWDVTVVDNGRAALEAIDAVREPFDCVVSDVNMPELDGFGLVTAMRKRDDDIPVLLMTGDPSLDGAVRAIDSGAVSYLAKPFDHEKLAAAVARAARRQGVARVRRRAESHAQHLYGARDDELAQRFSRALERAWMAFQPIVDVRTGRIYAYEALLRTEEESLRRADMFIATAERLDSVHELGRMVRAKVAAAAADAPPDVLLFVNVHGLELADEELFAADAPLAQHRLARRPRESPSAPASIRRSACRASRCCAASATGSRSMTSARVTPRSARSRRSSRRWSSSTCRSSATSTSHGPKRRVVTAIASLCRELGGKVVAEGVETAAERDVVVTAGVDLIQGYISPKPARGFQPLGR